MRSVHAFTRHPKRFSLKARPLTSAANPARHFIEYAAHVPTILATLNSVTPQPSRSLKIAYKSRPPSTEHAAGKAILRNEPNKSLKTGEPSALVAIISTDPARGCGEIGRRARFRFWFPKEVEVQVLSSAPFLNNPAPQLTDAGAILSAVSNTGRMSTGIAPNRPSVALISGRKTPKVSSILFAPA
jgi:hypothetical protein